MSSQVRYLFLGNLSLIIFLSFFLILGSCARQTAPTGGPKDTIPPNLVFATPKPGSKNITPTKIVLEFDESVQLNSPKDQIIINPTVEVEPVFTERRNTVIIELNGKFQDTTTYVINFRESLQDLTEKNVNTGFQYAFSTGDKIDSLEFSGTVFDNITQKPLKDVTVALYLEDTFNIFTDKATYISKSNKEGNFTISNLKFRKFFLYVFQDKNRNLKVDAKSESYGFHPKAIYPSTKLKIFTAHMDLKPIKVQNSRSFNNYAIVKFNKPIAAYRIRHSLPEDLNTYLEPDKTQLRIYSETKHDSIQINLSVRDSVGYSNDTTLFVKPQPGRSRKETFITNIIQSKYTSATSELQITYGASKPFGFSMDSLFIKHDSLGLIPIPSGKSILDSLNNTLTLTTKITLPETKSSYKLISGYGAIISCEGDTAKHLETPLEYRTQNNSSVIHFQVVGNGKSSVIVQLLNEKGVVQYQKNTPNGSFEYIKPGPYLLRAILDEDDNNQWTTGNWLTKRNMERIQYHYNDQKNTTINIPENWELGPLLITFE